MADVDLTALRDATARLVDMSNQVGAHWDPSEPLIDVQLDGLLAEAGQAEETCEQAAPARMRRCR